MIIHTVVIGAGPIGIITSYLLKLRGVEHFVLERSDVPASFWRLLWHDFRLATPLAEMQVPGMQEYPFSADYYPSGKEIMKIFSDYCDGHKLPIYFDTTVFSVTKKNRMFVIKSSIGEIKAINVIVCLGPKQTIKKPGFVNNIAHGLESGLVVEHSFTYRTPAAFFPNQVVLLVGSGLSALSITYDIIEKSNAQVYLACGKTDAEIIAANRHVDLTKQRPPHIPSLAKLKDRGVINLGRLIDADADTLTFTSGSKSLGMFGRILLATGYESKFHGLFDEFSAQHGAPVYQGYGINTEIAGLYVAGMPMSADDATETFTGGSRSAKLVVDAVTRVKIYG